MENSRILCPDARLPREERIACVVKEFDKWISNPYFVELVKRFGGTMDVSASAADAPADGGTDSNPSVKPGGSEAGGGGNLDG